MRTTGPLERLDSRPVTGAPDEIRAFLVVRNERLRLPFVLAHHRTLGVQRFFVVDNGSDDGTLDYLLVEPDVHVFRTHHAYYEARLGIDWIEELLNDHGHGRWCLVLDADEHLVYPDWESLPLSRLGVDLDALGLNCLATMFIDLYSDRPITETHVEGERSLVELCPFFDSTGYHLLPVTGSRLPKLYGGVRARLFWPEIDLADHAVRVASYLERTFDQDGYLALHDDVRAEVMAGRMGSALEHFLHYGHREGRAVSVRPLPDWPETVYLARHSDVADAVRRGAMASGLEHYVRYGQFEGRLIWRTGPPLLSQVPLVRWCRGMQLQVGRHSLDRSNWRRNTAVGGALLHFKLLADLASRGDANAAGRGAPAEEPEWAGDWAGENQRYRDALRRNPALSGMGPSSLRYRDPRQLLDLGLITPVGKL